MQEYLKIEVTPNVQECLKALKPAVESMPAGESKTRAEVALDYLDRTFKGEPLPEGGIPPPGIRCTPERPVVG